MKLSTTFLLNLFRSYLRMKATFFAVGGAHSVMSWQAKSLLLSHLSFQFCCIYPSGLQITPWGPWVPLRALRWPEMYPTQLYFSSEGIRWFSSSHKLSYVCCKPTSPSNIIPPDPRDHNSPWSFYQSPNTTRNDADIASSPLAWHLFAKFLIMPFPPHLSHQFQLTTH